MGIEDILDATFKAVSSCEVAAFGDTNSRLILRACHEDNVRREYLNALCDQAARCFRVVDTAVSFQSDIDDAEAEFNEATLVSQGKMTVFVRVDFTSPDFLCLVCRTPQDPSNLTSIAHDTLQKINLVQ
ncbi:MAG: hypothetical protein AAGF53_06415 [Pseudomonadota bacterium]